MMNKHSFMINKHLFTCTKLNVKVIYFFILKIVIHSNV